MLPKLKSLFTSMPAYKYSGPTLATALAAASARPSTDGAHEVAIFANGCFWGTQHFLDKTFGKSGLVKSEVGYIGGSATGPTYREVCSGQTGHAEAVKLT